MLQKFSKHVEKEDISKERREDDQIQFCHQFNDGNGALCQGRCNRRHCCIECGSRGEQRGHAGCRKIIALPSRYNA
jgi:hypothetical protein